MASRNTNNGKPSGREQQQRLRAYEARQTVHADSIQRRRRDNIIWAIVGVVVIAAAIVTQLAYSGIGPSQAPTASPSATATSAADQTWQLPDPSTAEGRAWTGQLDLNSDIDLGITLDGANAPQAVASTISLANGGFYDGLTCHRLTTSGIYVLQCGDPNGDGSGGPGYSYGPVENAPSDNVYPAGTLAMARQSGNGSSMGSQFFIVYQDSTIPADAAGGYTVIGQVTSGLDALQSEIIAQGTADGSTDGAPAVPTTISTFVVH